MKNKTSHTPASVKKTFFGVALFLAMLVTSLTAQAQTATVYGSVSNFDVINDTGNDAHGFEIEFEGIQPQDVAYTFSGQRYGTPTITQSATGAIVHWASTYSVGTFAQTTIPHASGTPFGGSCYQWGTNYNQSGCEHFGASLSARPVKTVYRWLIADPNTAGALLAVNPPVAIPNPTYVVNPPVAAGTPPELVAVIEAPEPPDAPELFGDAQWVKVFKTEMQREVGLNELVSDNAIVPQDAAHAEVAWEILQAEPASNSNGNRRRRQNQGSLNAGTRSVIRRYEIYRFTGAYDPTTHQALCADTLCNAPGANEVGDFVGAQMAAANVTVPAITVAKTGNGTVNATGANIRCGTLCTAFVNAGTVVNLTASPGAGSVFTGWNGACSGNQAVCSLTLNDSQNVTANFAQTLKVGVKTSGGKGTITSAAIGIDCGRNCNATVAQGTTVTFTIVPDAGVRFINWSGGCTGTALTCTVQANRDTQVQANLAR